MIGYFCLQFVQITSIIINEQAQSTRASVGLRGPPAKEDLGCEHAAEEGNP